MMPYTARAARYVNSYKEQEILMASPEKCVLHLYDFAIQGCANQQSEQASKALAMLIDALNYKAGGELATGLFRLYEFCLRKVHQRDFDTPQTILRDLRGTWHQAMTAKNMAA